MNRPAGTDVHSTRQGRVGLRGSRRLRAGSAEWVCNGNVRRRHARADLAHDPFEFRGQLDLARALAALGKPLAVIALRNPYDLSGLPAEIWKLAAYDYEEPALCALADVLRGGKAEGICPVEL